MIARIRKLFRRTDLEVLDDAIDRVAALQADAERHRIKANNYTVLVIATDPHTDWWTFAHAKQKQLDNQNEFAVDNERAVKALDRLQTLLDQLKGEVSCE